MTELRTSIRRPSPSLAVALLVLVVAASGVAFAAIPHSETGVISGCYENRFGVLRVIDTEAGQTCSSKETAISWNAQGVPQEPQFVTVDCGAGDTVGQALEETAFAPSVEITVLGTCTESVGIHRDDVTLVADPAGGTLAAPSGDDGILHLNGARINVEGMTLSGGAAGLIAQHGASFRAAELHITGAGTAVQVSGAAGSLDQVDIDACGEGIGAGDGAGVVVSGGSISGCEVGVQVANGAGVSLHGVAIADTTRQGILAVTGGSVVMEAGTTISNAGHIGAMAFGGDIFAKGAGTEITGSTFSGLSAGAGGSVSLNDGVRVAGNNGGGVSASNGGAVLMQSGVIVQNNTGDGVFLDGVSSLFIQDGVIVRENSGHGIFLAGTSVGEFGDDTNEIIQNGGWGIQCAGAPSVAHIQGDPGTVTGNTAGAIDC